MLVLLSRVLLVGLYVVDLNVALFVVYSVLAVFGDHHVGEAVQVHVNDSQQFLLLKVVRLDHVSTSYHDGLVFFLKGDRQNRLLELQRFIDDLVFDVVDHDLA